MNNSSAPPQCSDLSCPRPSESNVDTQCRKCERPIHSTCGVTLEDMAEGNGTVCSSCAATAQVQHSSHKAKRRRLNLSEKIRALDMMEDGVSLQEVADEFGSSKRAILRMRQEADVIRGLNQAGAKGSMKSRKQGNSAKYSALEAKVTEVINISRRNKISISNELVRDCSTKVQEEMLNNAHLSEEEEKDLREFTPTDFWIRSFARRHNIRIVSSRMIHMPVLSSEAPLTPECISLKNELQRYDPECIFSVHETTLFHKMLPRAAYLTTPEHGNAGASMRYFPHDMGLKDRITLIVCANATGTMKVPLAIVGKSKQPACFRIRPSPLPYLAQPHVWFDITTFKQWFSEVFIPSIRKHSWKNVALLVEDVDDENIAEDPRGQVKIMRLPLDSRPRHHPMERGILTLVKQRYRYAMLERVLELMSFRDAIQACNMRKSEALRGLDDGHDPNVLDAAELLYAIWQETSAQSMARSWLRTNVLPDRYNTSLVTKHGRSRAFGKAEILMESCTVQEKERIQRVSTTLRAHNISNRQISPNGSSAVATALSGINEAQLEAWLCLEDIPEIRAALVREAQDTVLGYTTGIGSNGTTDREIDGVVESDCTGQHSQLLPSLAAIAELFVPLEELAFASESGDAASHLRQAKRTLFEAKIKEMGPAALQPYRSHVLPMSFMRPNR